MSSLCNLWQECHVASDMQNKAINHLSGPARILAGPGSGKTFVIIQRICFLINQHYIPPEHILCLTFTKAAAFEMQRRYQNEKKENVYFGTIHSICYHILKDSGEFRQYSIISELNKRKYMLHILENKGFKEDDFWMATDILSAVSRKKNRLPYRMQELMERHLFEEIYIEYQKMLLERNLFDFDDMLEKCYCLLKRKESLLRKWQQQFKYILVDEFQDINMLQYEIIRLLAFPQNNLFVVGDDDQSIYGFRGALPDIMMRFVQDYPDAEQLFLTENYRSGNNITVFANQMISKNRNRLGKIFLSKIAGGEVRICYSASRREQEECLIADIKRLSSKACIESAVILRTNREVKQYTALLHKNGINVKENCKKYENLFQHEIAKDMRAFLCFCKEGCKRFSFLKIMNKPEHFFSEQALTEDRVSCELLKTYYQNNREMQNRVEKLFKQYEKVSDMSFYAAIRYFRKIIGYDSYLKEKAKNNQEYETYMRIAEQLTHAMKQHTEAEDSDAFFERMESLYSGCAKDTLKETGISVITMHVAKGMEFETVFLPDINEGVIPDRQCKSAEDLEEERRLLYVAITRAKQSLYIYYTRERGRAPSRFIKEFIPHQ